MPRLDPSKFYRTASGKPVLSLERIDDSSYPWGATVQGYPRSLSYTNCGQYYGNGVPDTLDLVEISASASEALWPAADELPSPEARRHADKMQRHAMHYAGTVTGRWNGSEGQHLPPEPRRIPNSHISVDWTLPLWNGAGVKVLSHTVFTDVARYYPRHVYFTDGTKAFYSATGIHPCNTLQLNLTNRDPELVQARDRLISWTLPMATKGGKLVKSYRYEETRTDGLPRMFPYAVQFTDGTRETYLSDGRSYGDLPFSRPSTLVNLTIPAKPKVLSGLKEQNDASAQTNRFPDSIANIPKDPIVQQFPPTPLDLTQPVQRRDGSPARIIATDRQGAGGQIVALVKLFGSDEVVYTYNEFGICIHATGSRNWDLINIPLPSSTPVTGYMAVRLSGETGLGSRFALTSHIYEKRSEAERFAGQGRDYKIIPVTWTP